MSSFKVRESEKEKHQKARDEGSEMWAKELWVADDGCWDVVWEEGKGYVGV